MLKNAFENLATEATSSEVASNTQQVALSSETIKENTEAIKDTTEQSNELLDLLNDGLIEIVRQLQAIRNDGGMADSSGRVRINMETGLVSRMETVGRNNYAGFALDQVAFAWTNSGAQNLRRQISV